MPTLTHFVRQATYAIIANTNLSFGTDGLGTCVGIVAKLNNGNNFCGHMDSAYEPTRGQEVQFKAAVTALLNAAIPVASVQSISFSTPGGTFAARFTTEAITALFPNAVPNTKSCIYLDSNGAVQVTDGSVTEGSPEYTGPFSIAAPN